jgi:polysaccharide biosynthesis/export protein
LSNRAGKNVVISHRDSPDKITTIEFSNDPEKAAATNVSIAPGDTISVSRAGIVYVVGDVSHPAGFIMDNNDQLTVLQAIALAGGPNGTASLDKSKVIRKTSNGVQEIPMPLKKILSAKANDVFLHADDVLFVPRSATKGVARRSAEAILQTATGLAIYHP